jgi:hypothetical protein
MAEYQMTLMDRQRIARDTMAFWLDTNGANFGFRAGQHADLSSETKVTILGPFHSQALLLTKSPS